MAMYTVDERERYGKTSRPYTFSGTLEVVHSRNRGGRLAHVAVYRRDDGQHVVEFRTRHLLGGDLAGDNYTIVAPASLRRAIVEGCDGLQAHAVARQLGFEIGEGLSH